MRFPKKYNVLHKNNYNYKNFDLIPIRYSDRNKIMKWRNEQIYHLRQSKVLSYKDQNLYFNEVVYKLFYEDNPKQILFSLLENNSLVAYGGLVHINWEKKTAELSFLTATKYKNFALSYYWKIFFKLIEEAAFLDLNLSKIYTYAFNIRKKITNVFKENGYKNDKKLKQYFINNGHRNNFNINSKINEIKLRRVNENDRKIILEWSNESQTRLNSFNSKKITIEEHNKWFSKKIKDKNSFHYMIFFKNKKAGIVRIEKGKSKSLIGINISKEFRGKKLSSKFLTLVSNKFLSMHKNQMIFAYIKNNNFKSIKSFESAGFNFYKSENSILTYIKTK